MSAEIFALAEAVGRYVMKPEAALALAVLDQLIEGIEQIGSVGVVLGNNAVALAVERVAQHQGLFGALIAEDHDEIGMDEALDSAEQSLDEAVSFKRQREFGDAAGKAV